MAGFALHVRWLWHHLGWPKGPIRADRLRRVHGVHLLAVKFSKPRSHHRPKVSIGFRIIELTNENYQVSNIRTLSRFG